MTSRPPHVPQDDPLAELQARDRERRRRLTVHAQHCMGCAECEPSSLADAIGEIWNAISVAQNHQRERAA
jgi:hypothetical protein